MASHPQQPHAVLVSGPGLGHVNGCLLLAKSLLDVGFSITLACFARSYAAHASKGRINLPPASPIRLEVVSDGHPPLDNPSYADLFLTSPAMYDGLLHLLHKLAAEQHPATCLISDTIMGYPTQEVADHLGLPRVDYWTASATSYVSLLALPDLLSRGLIRSHKGPRPSSWKSKNPIFVDCIPGFPSYPLDEVPSDFRFAESEHSQTFRPFLAGAQRAKRAACVLIHTVDELEKEAFRALQDPIGMNAYPIGPLVNQYDVASLKNDPTLMWLDSHAPSSVMYVAFGSNATLTEQQMSELALGLEASGHAFLWVIRSDAVESGRQLSDVLPRGFFERTAQRGLIVAWVSQLAVLSHPAVGGFLSHCGWNSTLEGLCTGVPVLCHPQRAEQPLNCRLIVKDWDTGIELETTDEGTFSRIHVEKGVRTLLDRGLGCTAGVKAKELSHVVRKAPCQGGQSHSNLVKFATFMREMRVKNERAKNGMFLP